MPNDYILMAIQIQGFWILMRIRIRIQTFLLVYTLLVFVRWQHHNARRIKQRFKMAAQRG